MIIVIYDDDIYDTYVSNIIEGVSNGINNIITTTTMMKVLV